MRSIGKSEETIAKFSVGQKTGQPVEVTDLKLDTKTEYHAIRAAAKALGLDRRYIENFLYLNQTEPVLGRFTFKLVGKPGLDTIRKQSTSLAVEVTIFLKLVTTYRSVSLAAKTLGVRQPSLSLYLKEGRKSPYRKRYKIVRVDCTETDP